MEILEMIAEWRKGCSISGKHPVECSACTEALIDKIEQKEQIAVFSGCITPRFDKVIERLKAATSHDYERRRGMRDDTIVSVNDIYALLHEFYRVDRQMRRMYAENAKLHNKLESEEEGHRVC